MKLLAIVPIAAALASVASAAELHVDATGAGGAFTTIQAAMLVAQPGDRIIVAAGDYPAFHLSRGVSVIGNVVGPMIGTALYEITHTAPYLLNAAIMVAVVGLAFGSRRIRTLRV